MTTIIMPPGEEPPETGIALASSSSSDRRASGNHLPCRGVEIDVNHWGLDGDCDVDSDLEDQGVGNPARSTGIGLEAIFGSVVTLSKTASTSGSAVRGSVRLRRRRIRKPKVIATTVFTLRRVCLALGIVGAAALFLYVNLLVTLRLGMPNMVPISDFSRSSCCSEP